LFAVEITHDDPRVARCPECASPLDVSAFAAGSAVECPECRRVFPVPEYAPRARLAQPETSVLVIGAEFVLVSAAVFYAPLALLSLALAAAGLVDVRKNPRRLKGEARAWWSMAVSAFVLLLYLALIPRPLPDLFYEEPPAEIEERILCLRDDRGPAPGGAYAHSLDVLLKVDKNLLDNPGVTFVFGDCNHWGYTFTTLHSRGARDDETASGRREFVFTD
jgi:hypothetical protein